MVTRQLLLPWPTCEHSSQLERVPAKKVKWVSQLSQFLSKYAFLEALSSSSHPHTVVQNLDMYLKVLGNVVSQLGP